MSRLWMCRNCMDVNESGVATHGRKFTADLPVCPNCGCDRSNPRHAQYIGEVEVIHLDPPDPILNDRGCNRAACDDRIVIGSLRDTPDGSIKPHFGSAHKTSVTCPACKETEAYKSGPEAGHKLRAI